MMVEVFNVDCYENGKFSTIESPLVFPEENLELADWENQVNTIGYTKIRQYGFGERSSTEVWRTTSISADADYPYFVIFDELSEGRIIFMKNWFDVTHFLSNHMVPLAVDEITGIRESVSFITSMFEDR
jgi:hypothetical protein